MPDTGLPEISASGRRWRVEVKSGSGEEAAYDGGSILQAFRVGPGPAQGPPRVREPRQRGRANQTMIVPTGMGPVPARWGRSVRYLSTRP